MIQNFTLVAQQVFVLFILIFIGFLSGKKGLLGQNSIKCITDIVLYIVTPCVMITAFQREFSFELLGNIGITACSAALIMTASIFISKLVFRDKNESRKKVLQFAVVFSNCGFMSLPLQKAILGDDGWFYGSIFVAVFNIIVWTYGLVDMSGDIKQLSLKRLMVNPGIIGVLVSLIIFICGIKLPYILSQPCEYLSNLNTPVPMLIIGYYLSKANFKKAFTERGTYFAIAVRLIVIPVASLFVMKWIGVDSTILVTCIIAASAPTAATTTMFSAKFNRDVEASVSIVAATTIVSIITMPVIVALAQTIV